MDQNCDWNGVVRKYFPHAKTGKEITKEYVEKLENEFGGDRKTTLLATSLCSDDINTTSTSFAQLFFGPFTMGGLGGLPFGGITAISAYGHHIPDEGTAFVFYGPHIGITCEGELGKMRRPGQQHFSNSCGALMLALSRISEQKDLDRPSSTTFDDDHQQRAIEKELLLYREEIVNSPLPKKVATEVMYKIIDQKVRELVISARKEIHGKRAVLLGGIIINTDPNVDDFVDVRDFEVIDL